MSQLNQSVAVWESPNFVKANNEAVNIQLAKKGMPFRVTQEWWKLSDI